MRETASQQQLSFMHDHRRLLGVPAVQSHPLSRRRSTKWQRVRLVVLRSSSAHHQLWQTHERLQSIPENVVGPQCGLSNERSHRDTASSVAASEKSTVPWQSRASASNLSNWRLDSKAKQESKEEAEKRGDDGNCDRPQLRLPVGMSRSAAAATPAAAAVRQASECSLLADKTFAKVSLIGDINKAERVVEELAERIQDRQREIRPQSESCRHAN